MNRHPSSFDRMAFVFSGLPAMVALFAAACSGPAKQLLPGFAFSDLLVEALPGNPLTVIEIADGRVMSDEDGSVTKYDRRGAKQWQLSPGGDISAVASSESQILIATQLAQVDDDGNVATLTLVSLAQGAQRSQLRIPGTGQIRIADIVRFSDGFLIAGEFTDSMRLGAYVLSSAGGTDGFYARIKDDGTVTWAHRFGGNYNDTVAKLAISSDTQFAFAGTFTRRADFRGKEIVAVEPRSPVASVFVATLDADGTLSATNVVGSPHPIAIADIAVNKRGEIALALTARQQLQWDGKLLDLRGSADGVVAWYDATLHLRHAAAFGGDDYDGASALHVAASGHWLLAGWCSGTCDVAGSLRAADGTAAYLAVLDDTLHPVDVTAITSAQHEWAGPFARTATTWSLLVRGGNDLAISGKAVSSPAAVIRSR
jgi:hypothetical protein